MENIQTTQSTRKVIELKQGVSLDSISDGDIFIYDGTKELVTVKGTNLIATLRRLPRDSYGEAIERIHRWTTDYDTDVGRFLCVPMRHETITPNNNRRRYDIHDKILKGAGL